MLYQSINIDQDAYNLINGFATSTFTIPRPIINMIFKYWSTGAMKKLIRLNKKYYSYTCGWFRRVPFMELSRITCKCEIKSFTYKICVVIDNIFVSIYPSIGKYRINSESKKMICPEFSKDLLNHPVKDCSIELKFKFFKAFACEIDNHKHENSFVEIIIYHQDIFDFAGTSICINLNDDIFTKEKFLRVYCWNGTINTYFDVWGDKCLEDWESDSFMDGIWRFRK